MNSLKAGVTYFALVFGTGFLMGIIRVPFLVPTLGVRTAELALATVVQDQSLAAYIASRDPISGSVYLLMLGVFALMPRLLSRQQSHQRARIPEGISPHNLARFVKLQHVDPFRRAKLALLAFGLDRPLKGRPRAADAHRPRPELSLAQNRQKAT